MLQIDYRSSESLYIQIKNNFKNLILSDGLKENDLLPSVRNLASELAINVNTVQRAYRELEQEGYIYSIPGKGNFVAKVGSNIIDRNFDEFKIELIEVLKRGKILGIPKDKVIKITNDFFSMRGDN